MNQTSYDGIILGAGHNGLILQAYLGKAGLKVWRSSGGRSLAAA
jgi:ribulose 1,5-bisphosphate synthetase/thiazole synthase